MGKKIKKILVVDDEPDLCRMVKRALEGGGEFEVITTINPAEVSDICEVSRPDLILLDVLMPQVSGPELLQKLRCDPRTACIPIIMTSGDGKIRYVHHQDAWEMNNSEADLQNWRNRSNRNQKTHSDNRHLGDDFLAKPFSLKTLLSVVRDILDRSEHYRPSPPEP
jgi:CheY-like chemotaxis protein